MNHNPDKRDFNRFPVEFELKVSAEDNEEKKFEEQTVLQDISGEGARFISQLPDNYYPDQLLNLVIYLPGTEDVKAHMCGKVTVVRIVSPGVLDINEKNSTLSIAVKFESSLLFERDAKTV